LNDEEKRIVIQILGPSLKPETKDTITYDDKNYDVFLDANSYFFPGGVPFELARDYLNFNQRINFVIEYFDDTSDDKSADFLPTLFYGFKDVTTMDENHTYTGLYNSVHRDRQNRLILFEFTYSANEELGEVIDKVNMKELA